MKKLKLIMKCKQHQLLVNTFAFVMGYICAATCGSILSHTDEKQNVKQDKSRKKCQDHGNDALSPLPITITCAKASKSKKYLQQQIDVLLNKHGFIHEKDKAYVFELLDIALDHECYCLARNLENGENLHKIFGSSNIEHKITFQTTRKLQCYNDKSYGFVANTSNTVVTFSGRLKNLPFKHCITRHMIQIPLVRIIFDAYNIVFPPAIAAVIGNLLHGKTGKPYEMYGLCYPCLTGIHKMVPNININSVEKDGDIDENEKENLKQKNIYKEYIRNDVGDITWTSQQGWHYRSKERAFHNCYQHMVDSYNEQMDKYLKTNKLYKIGVMKQKLTVIHRPVVEHYLLCDRQAGFGQTYQLKTKFCGFNNLNMNQVATDENTTIKSQKFEIDWRDTANKDVRVVAKSEKIEVTNMLSSLSEATSYHICIGKLQSFMESYHRVTIKLHLMSWDDEIKDELII